MNYKKALFVYKVLNNDGDQLLFNVRTNKMLKISKDHVLDADRLLNQDVIDEDEIRNKSHLTNALIDGGFLIPESFDEVKWCKMKKNEVLFGTDDLEILLIPTNMCNFKCSYCFQDHIENYMSEETEQRIIKFLEKKIPKSKMLRLGLFGGEPLLCSDQLIRIATAADKICKSNGVPMVGEISTNGYLLTPDLFNKLLKLRIYDFQVCVDGPKEQHNKTRPHKDNNDSYSVIMNNLRAIKNNVKRHNFRFTIRINLTPSLEPYLDSFLQELAQDFKDEPSFQIAIQCVRDWGGNVITSDQIVEEEQSRYRRWYSRIRELGMLGAGELSFNPFTFCTAYRKNGYIINYDASLLKCTHTQQDENLIGFIDKNGNVKIDDWKLSKWLISDRDDTTSQQCEKCIIYPFCMEGFCPYAKNIRKKYNCPLGITLSMMHEKLLDLDKQCKLKQI